MRFPVDYPVSVADCALQAGDERKTLLVKRRPVERWGIVSPLKSRDPGCERFLQSGRHVVPSIKSTHGISDAGPNTVAFRLTVPDSGVGPITKVRHDGDGLHG